MSETNAMLHHIKNLLVKKHQWKVNVPSVHIIEIAFDNIEDRDYAAGKIERLLYEEGQIGIIILRTE